MNKHVCSRGKRFSKLLTARAKVIAEKVLCILIRMEHHGIIETKYQIWESDRIVG